MKTKEDVEKLEKLIGQLNRMYAELSVLAKKSPNDGINLFKMNLINKVLRSANEFLVGDYLPFDDFDQFSQDSLPTNSDVTLILSQYMEQVERFRSDHVLLHAHKFRYVVNGEPGDVEARPPTRIGARRE